MAEPELSRPDAPQPPSPPVEMSRMRDTDNNVPSLPQVAEAAECDAHQINLEEALEITYPNMVTAADGLPVDDDL